MIQTIILTSCSSAGSILALFLLTKLMGYRQISQLSGFDYLNGITIGSIAAEMAVNPDDLQKPLTALIVYSVVTWLIAICCNHFRKVRKVMEGEAVVLLDAGRIDQKNMKKVKLDFNEFMMELRLQGYFDISDIQTAVMEENGKISILPKTRKRPVQTGDMSFHPPIETLSCNLILEGNILLNNLYQAGKTELWLGQELNKLGIDSVDEVLFASLNSKGEFSAFRKNEKTEQFQLFL